MDNLYDVVSCIGPNDYSLIEGFIINVSEKLENLNKIYIITQKGIIEKFSEKLPNVCFIDEEIFPFSKSNIDELFKTPQRSGWYLQQLLKLYAPFIVRELLDNYVIIDSDIHFHKKVHFFKDNKILFNTGTEHHYPYFDHMKKIHPSLFRVKPVSGICHLMPMKRQIVQSLFHMIESYHNESFWKVFLNSCDLPLKESGASEYEILFNYTLLYKQDDYEINNITWRNTGRIDNNYEGVYEACHHYMRG